MIVFPRAVKQLEKNPEICERKETEVWQGRESLCYSGDNYFRESQRLDVPLYQSSKKKTYIQNPGRSKLGREIHFRATKVSLKNNCYVFLFTQGKRGGMNMFGQPLFRQKPEQVLVHQTQARE